MDALDEWEDIVMTANFDLGRLKKGAPATSKRIVLVCLPVSENELCIREAFAFTRGKFISSVNNPGS